MPRSSKRSLVQASLFRGVVPRVEERLCLGDRAVPLEDHTVYTLVQREEKKSKWLLLCGKQKQLGFLEEQLGLPTRCLSRSLSLAPGPLKTVRKQTSQSSSDALVVPLQGELDEDLEDHLDEDLDDASQDDHVPSLPALGSRNVIEEIIDAVGSLLVINRYGRRLATNRNIAVTRDSCFEVIVRRKTLTVYVPRWPQVYLDLSKEILEWLVQELSLDVQNGVPFVEEKKPPSAQGSLPSETLTDIVKRLALSTPQQYRVMWCASRHSFNVQCKATGKDHFIRVQDYAKHKRMGQEYLDQKLLETEGLVKAFLDGPLPGLDPLVQCLEVEPSMCVDEGSLGEGSLGDPANLREGELALADAHEGSLGDPANLEEPELALADAHEGILGDPANIEELELPLID